MCEEGKSESPLAWRCYRAVSKPTPMPHARSQAQAKPKGCRCPSCRAQHVSPSCCMSAGAKLILRFEPFLLHAECMDMEAAQALLQAARLAGFRESGATIGSSGGRVMVRMTVRVVHDSMQHDSYSLPRLFARLLAVCAIGAASAGQCERDVCMPTKYQRMPLLVKGTLVKWRLTCLGKCAPSSPPLQFSCSDPVEWCYPAYWNVLKRRPWLFFARQVGPWSSGLGQLGLC